MDNKIDLPKLKNSFMETIKEVEKFIENATLTELFKFVLDLGLLCILIILFKLPIELLIDLGGNIFINNNIIYVWKISLNILYTIFAIAYYLNTFKKRYINIKEKFKTNNKN